MRHPVAAAALLACAVSTTRAAEVTVAGHTFKIPDGFELKQVAGPDLAPRPVSGSLDDQGRLYVTDSSGSNLPPAEQVKNPTHRVLRLEDTDGDGRFDKAVVFADKVMFPQGCLWHDGWVYVAAPPSIWRFRDADGDGVAETREEWFKGGTLTGCANDIHGPYLGPDGHIYWTKGAFAEQTHERPGRPAINDKAAHIYRALPDGSDLEIVMTGGMDNPVKVAFTAENEPVFTSTFIDFSQPGWRDGIGHAVYGGVFGKVNNVLEDRRVVRTGPDLFHPFVQFGAGAPTGLCRYEGTSFGPEYKDNLFASTFNLHKVSRHILRPAGATYASTDSDLVVGLDVDFHPTDILEDADGSLLILDTGGWYKLCCPTSQLSKPDVLGAVYRLSKTGPKHTVTAADRKRRTAPPSARGPQWTLKQAALARDPKKLKDFQTPVQTYLDKNTPVDGLLRVAIEGLGRLGNKAAAPALFEVAARAKDAYLEHTALYALIEIADVKATESALKSTDPAVRRAGFIVMDQIGVNLVPASDAVALLGEGNTRLWGTGQWILSRHPEWSDDLTKWFRTQADDPTQRGSLAPQLRFLVPGVSGRELLASLARSTERGPALQRGALTAMADASPKEPPTSWREAVLEPLRSAEPETVSAAVRAARLFAKDPTVAAAVARAARSTALPDAVRLQAYAALDAGWTLVDGDFAYLTAGDGQAMTREGAGALAKAKLEPTQLRELTGVLAHAAPMPLLQLLPAFDRGGDAELGRAVLASLRDARSRKTLRPDLVRSALKAFPPEVRTEGEALVAELSADAAKQSAQLESLLTELHPLQGDVRRGQAIFLGAKAACYTCHSIGYLGGKVGPDLTSIGQARTERDLLESIVFPSATFVRSYEPMIVITKTGDEFAGIVKSETDREIVVVSGPGVEQHIARADVADQRPGSVSLMPAGLDAQLSRQELADLLIFLKNTKWGAN